ncbi:hypothetical protein O5D80_002297 [Batrachochytrium dendrobatidis]|nr:hypothetical protein O5D80_004023 [Batrachochytrium dendrobatidis]KAJ8329463.1 hypothetical protein O5D80_002297 [Batrachochytrium dendrobatidis]
MGKKSIVKENRLSSVTIEDTPEKLKRDPSSEEFLEKHFEEISFGGSAATENLKKVARETFASMINATGFGVAEGWIPAVKEKHISIKYKGRAFDLEVSSMQSLSEVISTADSFFLSLCLSKCCTDLQIMTL